MYEWTEIARLPSEYEFEDYRWRVMCCSVSYQTETSTVCEVCAGDHPHVLHRIRCTSVTCSPDRDCAVKWNAFHCTPRDDWVVKVNDQGHGRGALSCTVTNVPRVTKEMKGYIVNQKIKEPPHGMPSRQQIANALKKIRADDGSGNTIEGIEDFVASHVYTPSCETNPVRAFIFGPILDINGLPRVGSGDDDDPFILGVTSMRLIDDTLRHAQPGRFSIFHADATFKLSDYVITCGITDSARVYQLRHSLWYVNVPVVTSACASRLFPS